MALYKYIMDIVRERIIALQLKMKVSVSGQEYRRMKTKRQ